jgi:hypothetical protein
MGLLDYISPASGAYAMRVPFFLAAFAFHNRFNWNGTYLKLGL